MIETLLLGKIDTDIGNHQGFTALHILVQYEESEDSLRGLELLVKAVSDIDQENKWGETALHLAVRWGNSKSVSLLLLNGADASKPNLDGETPLHYAVRERDHVIVKELMDFGASTQVSSSVFLTPAELASKLECPELVALLQSQVSPSTKMPRSPKAQRKGSTVRGTPPRLMTLSDELKPPPEPISEDQIQHQVRLRVMAFCTLWVRDAWSDFESSSLLFCLLIEWLESLSKDVAFRGACETLKTTIVQSMSRAKNQDGKGALMTINASSYPQPLLPKDTSQAEIEKDPFLLDLLEIARQLTLKEQHLFQAIQPSELLDANWTKPNKRILAPNLIKLIAHVNGMAAWVTNSVVCHLNVKDRTKQVEKWIRVAQHCRELSNFNGVLEILSGLSSTCVFRLRKTWEGVDPRLMSTYDELKKLMSSSENSHAYREALRHMTPPCVPYIGNVLTDLTFTEEGMESFLDPEKQIINFQKRQVTAFLIAGLQNIKFPSYALHEIEFIQSLVTNVWTNSLFYHSPETLHAFSKLLEP